MHEFHSIARVNKEQIQSLIPAHQAQGQFVVAEFHGLHFVDFKPFSDQADAETRLHELNSETGRKGVLYRPTVPVVSAEPCSS
jgi:hypothetical protein